MNLNLENKTALVTGSGQGIGAAIARRLAEEGANIVTHSRNIEKARAVADEITAAGGKAVAVGGTLDDDDSAAHIAADSIAAFGQIDILVNNAGVYAEVPWFEATPEYWSGITNTNVLSQVRLINLLVPAMKARGWGRVIGMASDTATSPREIMPAYSMTKGANVSIAVSLAKALARSGVTSNAISPGATLTPGLQTYFEAYGRDNGWPSDWPSVEARIIDEFLPNMTGRLATDEDVAAVAVFLASPLADQITGTNMRVDGGTLPTIN
jgi:3-oxoacyl-[acyl-carrier protein] reductase